MNFAQRVREVPSVADVIAQTLTELIFSAELKPGQYLRQDGQHLTHPRQWAALPLGDERPRREPTALQLPHIEVERRPLALYEQVAKEVGAR